MTNKRQQSTPPPTQPKRKKQGSTQLPTEESLQNTPASPTTSRFNPTPSTSAIEQQAQQSLVPLSTTSPTDSAEKSEVVMPVSGRSLLPRLVLILWWTQLRGENRTQAAQSPVPPLAASSSRHPGSPASPAIDLNIFCLLLPDDEPHRHIFPVTLGRDRTVSDLKKGIKLEKANDLKDIDADKLILFKVLPSSQQTSLSLLLLLARAVDSSWSFGAAEEPETRRKWQGS